MALPTAPVTPAMMAFNAVDSLGAILSPLASAYRGRNLPSPGPNERYSTTNLGVNQAGASDVPVPSSSTLSRSTSLIAGPT